MVLFIAHLCHSVDLLLYMVLFIAHLCHSIDLLLCMVLFIGHLSHSVDMLLCMVLFIGHLSHSVNIMLCMVLCRSSPSSHIVSFDVRWLFSKTTKQNFKSYRAKLTYIGERHKVHILWTPTSRKIKFGVKSINMMLLIKIGFFLILGIDRTKLRIL